MSNPASSNMPLISESTDYIFCQFIFCQIGKNWQKNIFISKEIIVVKLALANYKNANYANLANLKYANANFYCQKINNSYYNKKFEIIQK